MVSNIEGGKGLRSELTGDSHHAEQLGITVAEDLLVQGAAEILEALKNN